MAKFIVPVIFKMYGEFTVEAESQEEAVLIAYGKGLPEEREYVEDSLHVDQDEVREDCSGDDTTEGEFRKANFRIEDGDIHQGYTQGGRGNGWAMPCFNKGVAEKIIESLCNFDENKAPYCWETDLFTIYAPQEIVPDGYVGRDIVVEGKTIHTYAIGAGSWCWDECAPIGGSDALFRCSICQVASTAKEWNQATLRDFGGKIEEVESRESDFHEFSCPQCFRTSMKESLVQEGDNVLIA